MATVREAADEKGHDLAVVLPQETIWLDADPVRVLQVIENLLSNAVKYTNSGGSIEVAVSRDDGFAAVRVSDDGIGIDGDLIAQIFEPFTQASSAPRSPARRSRHRPDAGATVHRDARRHGLGFERWTRTVAASSWCAGRLPHRRPTRPAPADASPRTAPAGRRVLVVDDNVTAASMLALLLERLGAERVEVATDGITAVSKARELLPDLVLLDIGLPGKDGYQVARELRGHRELDGRCWWRSPATARSRTACGRARQASTSTW